MPEALIKDIIEEVLAENPRWFFDEVKTARRVLEQLLRAARPGNWAWRRLENEFGFHGDYVYGQDEGVRG